MLRFFLAVVYYYNLQQQHTFFVISSHRFVISLDNFFHVSKLIFLFPCFSLSFTCARHSINSANVHHTPAASVYQVTRPGHEHCDITEGELLDITPLVVDGKKLVTLYDKDLTEGVNFLIGE